MRKDETRHAWRSKLSGVRESSGEFNTTSARRAATPSRPRNWLVDTLESMARRVLCDRIKCTAE